MKYTKTAQSIQLSGKLITFDSPKVMGIVNLTPDSFFDGGQYLDEEKSLARIAQLVRDGVDILDIGAYSSRSGADDVTAEEEGERLLPIIKKSKERFPEIPISVDTFRADVAEKAIQAGADLINDISGGEMDKRM